MRILCRASKTRNDIMRRASCALLLVVAMAGWIAGALEAADVKQLAAQLGSGPLAERQAAADALADLGYGAQAAVPELVAALGSSDPELRWRAARALGVIGDAKAAGALRKQAADPETMVRAQAIFALGRLRASD